MVNEQDLQRFGGGHGLGGVVAVRAEPRQVVPGGAPGHEGVDAAAVVALGAQRGLLQPGPDQVEYVPGVLVEVGVDSVRAEPALLQASTAQGVPLGGGEFGIVQAGDPGRDGGRDPQQS